jgi:hypothetical protein
MCNELTCVMLSSEAIEASHTQRGDTIENQLCETGTLHLKKAATICQFAHEAGCYIA